MKARVSLATNVIYEGVNNNKLLLLAGAIIGEGLGILYLGVPEIDFINLYKCLASTRPYLPYLGAAIGGAVVMGLGKIALNTLFYEMDAKSKETTETSRE